MRRVVNYIILAAVFMVAASFQGFALDEKKDVELGEIVITPYSGMEGSSLSSLSYSAKVFTQNDIQKTGASVLLDFLKKESSINVSDWYGTGVKANVDLMGFGDNASSNLLVLVNGRRINDIDMSGADWTQIPLDNVEKVEVLKGGGVVLYGDNASGGIINIITKKPSSGKLKAGMKIKSGSYSLDDESISLSGGTAILSFSAYAEHYSTNGYRDNSHYRSKYVNINMNSKLTDSLVLSFEGGHHRYRYGLPGALYDTDIGSGYTRRDTKYPKDNARMEDDYLNLSLKNRFTDNLKAAIDVGFRNKNALENLLTWSLVTDKGINSFTLKPQVFITADILGLRNDLIGGLDFYRCDLSADSSSHSDIDRSTNAVFLQDSISLNDNLSLSLGARIENERFTFDYTSSSSSTDDGVHYNKESYEGGLNYRFNNKKTNAFLHFSRGFRIPKTDEYLVTWPSAQVNKNLLPQTSKSVSWGLNHCLNRNITASADFFVLSLNNEIYYNPLTYANSNYGRTRRRGINFSLDLKPIDKIDLSLGYRFIDAEFKKGPYSGKTVPEVPKSKFNLSLKYEFARNFSLFVDSLYRGKSYLINDLSNKLDKLDSFWITNIKLSFKKKNVEVFAGINNLFNEKYCEYASTNSSGSVRALYPSPERNFFWGMKVGF